MKKKHRQLKNIQPRHIFFSYDGLILLRNDKLYTLSYKIK